MYALLLTLQDDGLTFGEFVNDIPHDLAAFVVYALLAAFMILIWRGSRSGKQP